jgi:hypothetical protein
VKMHPSLVCTNSAASRYAFAIFEKDMGVAEDEEKTDSTGEIKVDPDVPKWLKIAAAIVTIVAAIAGLCFTAGDCRDKPGIRKVESGRRRRKTETRRSSTQTARRDAKNDLCCRHRVMGFNVAK